MRSGEKKKMSITRKKLLKWLGIMLLACSLAYGAVYYAQFMMQLHIIRGTYESVTSKKYEPLYVLAITGTVKFRLSDDQGRHIMEGSLQKEVNSPDLYILSCSYDSKYNGEKFLDMKDKTNHIRIHPEKKDKLSDAKRKAIYVSNDTGAVYFVEKE